MKCIMSQVDNVDVQVNEKSDTDTAAPQETQQGQQSGENNVNLVNVEVKDENTALNLMVGFLGVAQRRGTFAINESAKIYECIKMFQHPRTN